MNIVDVTKENECCYSCIHNKRTFDKDYYCTCTCELDGHRIGYVANFESVCEEWKGAYQKGFEDGKAVNDKGCEGCKYGGTPQGDTPCFNCSNYYKNNWTAKDDKIEVGDEVIYNGTTKCIVVRPEDDERYASLIDGDGTHYSADHRECKKTGRHFDIDKILEGLRYDD